MYTQSVIKKNEIIMLSKTSHTQKNKYNMFLSPLFPFLNSLFVKSSGELSCSATEQGGGAHLGCGILWCGEDHLWVSEPRQGNYPLTFLQR
jgi:hypothetical protein